MDLAKALIRAVDKPKPKAKSEAKKVTDEANKSGGDGEATA